MSESKHKDVLLAGAFAAFSVDLLVYPLDTLKTRFQSPDYKKIYYDPSKNALKRGLLFNGLYQGIGSVILITIPSSAAFFTTYEGLKSFMIEVNPTLQGSSFPLVPQPIIDSASSSVAELVSCLILTPAEVLKQNAQMVRRPDSASKGTSIFQTSTTLQAFKQFKTPSQLFRGYTALAARNLPFTAMQFPMFEHLKKTIRARRKANGTETGSLLETASITAASAGMAGSVAAVITTPVDVVKTRIMLSAAGESDGSDGMKKVEEAKSKGISADKLAKMEGGKKKSSMTIAKEIYRGGGIRGLFRGGALRGAWTALGSGLYLGVYESGRVWLGDTREDGENVL